MSARPENPPAFPRDARYFGYDGMTLRDWFAGQALAGCLANPTCMPMSADFPEVIASAASFFYQFADAMLAERDRTK